MVWTLGTVSYYNTMHLNSYHTILLLKNLQYHSTWKINCNYLLLLYNTIPILGGMRPLDQLQINVINEDHSRSIAINLDHFSSIMINLRSITINFAHLPSLGFSRTHMGSLALTWAHLRSIALTALNCAQLRSLAIRPRSKSVSFRWK